MNRRILRLAAWAALVGIALIALLPAGTILTHPSTMGDRMFRYAVLAILFVLAYPRSLPAVMAVTIGCAVCL